MKYFVFLFLVVSAKSFSCGMEVPVEVEWQYGIKPTAENAAFLLIKAPLKYNGWSNSGLHYKKGEVSFSIKEYISEETFPGVAVYDMTVTTEFIEEGKFSVNYTPGPVIDKNGVMSFMPCLHVQELEIPF